MITTMMNVMKLAGLLVVHEKWPTPLASTLGAYGHDDIMLTHNTSVPSHTGSDLPHFPKKDALFIHRVQANLSLP